jgi:CelD/BcsL family acetyltransferase involved in cellulose biosynthesis
MVTTGSATGVPARAVVSVAPSPAAGVLIVESQEELKTYVDAWTGLASQALVPNPFYEPWMLLPALQYLPDGRDVIFALVFVPGPNGRRFLTGFLPLKIRRLPLRVPMSVISTWIHKYCYLSMPLLHRVQARETLQVFFDWLKSNPYHGRILDLRLVPGDGPFQTLLSELLTVRKQLNLVVRSFPRAVFQCSGRAEDHFERSLSSKMRRHIRTYERRLAELGEARYIRVESAADLETWIEDFLKVEASGWRGKEGVSFSQDPSGTKYLKAMLRDALSGGHTMLNMLTLDGKPIALQGIVMTGGGAFGFVMTYDEGYAKYSPGVLLACEATRALQEMGSVEWMDSCAHCDHPLFDRLWRDRRMMQRILVSDGTTLGDWLTSAAPMLQWARGIVTRPRKPARHVGTNNDG